VQKRSAAHLALHAPCVFSSIRRMCEMFFFDFKVVVTFCSNNRSWFAAARLPSCSIDVPTVPSMASKGV
jgi:hypothetical protein